MPDTDAQALVRGIVRQLEQDIRDLRVMLNPEVRYPVHRSLLHIHNRLLLLDGLLNQLDLPF